MVSSIAKKKIVVVGGSRGLGLGMVEALVARGATVSVVARGPGALREVSQRLGVSQHLLYAWKRQLARQVSGDAGKDVEIRQLKRELARVTEERDILKKPPRILPGMQSEIRVCCRAS